MSKVPFTYEEWKFVHSDYFFLKTMAKQEENILMEKIEKMTGSGLSGQEFLGKMRADVFKSLDIMASVGYSLHVDSVELMLSMEDGKSIKGFRRKFEKKSDDEKKAFMVILTKCEFDEWRRKEGEWRRFWVSWDEGDKVEIMTVLNISNGQRKEEEKT